MKVKKDVILLEAKQIKDYIEKNKKIPKACTLSDGTVLSPYSTSYLIAKLINNINSSQISLTNVIVYNADKHTDTINEKVVKDDYLFMITNFLNYCVDHKRVPSYITTKNSKTKVSFELFMYCLSKIANFYKENKVFPNYCEFKKTDLQNTATNANTNKNSNSQSTSTNKNSNNCTNPYTSKPHLKDSNKGQDTPYGCANNAEQQAFYKLLGKVYKESELAKLSATTTNGTSHQGIETCIAAISKKTGVKLTVKWVNFSDLGKTIEERFEALGKIICQKNKAVITHIAYVNGGEKPMTKDTKVYFGHYDGPIEQIDTKRKIVKVISSLGTKKANGSYTGKIQERPYSVEASYLRYTPGGQPSICIITKG